MKIAILYHSKFGNTKELAIYLAQKVKEKGHEIQLFRTTENKPKTLFEFDPDAMLVGGPTQFGKPVRKLSNYIKKLGKIVQKTSIEKAAVFNCYTSDDVTKIIQEQIADAFPKIKLMEKTLPILTGDGTGENWNKVMLQEKWEEEASSFISDFLVFL